MTAPASSLVIYGGLFLIVLLTSAAMNLFWSEVQTRRLNARVSQALAVEGPNRAPLAGTIGLLQHAGEWLRKLHKPATIDHLRTIIETAGFNPHRTLPLLLAGKFLVTAFILIGTALAAYLCRSPAVGVLVFALGGIVGVMGPEWILRFIRGRFAAQLQRGTPDALDLLVVCSEAGMGLESALERVAQEMRQSNRAMAAMLGSLLDDLRVLPDRRQAFANLGTRSGVEGLKRFATMVSQSQKYGSPIGTVLRAVAEELRRDRMNKLEERAVKLPAKLIFPLILFIMPSLYIVLLGPSFMQLFDSLKLATRTLHH
jgi:tight adherence protein C